MSKQYKPVDKDLSDLRWDTPSVCQGQIIEVSYAEPFRASYLACLGARYKRIKDHSTGAVQYYQLATESE